MKIKVADLRKYFPIANKVFPKKTTLPILEQILVRDGYFIVTDIQNTLYYPIKGINKKLNLTIPYRELRDFIKGAKDEIEITRGSKKFQVVFKKGILSASFRGKDTEDFPAYHVEVKWGKEVDYLSPEVLDSIKRQLPIMATDILRPALTGLYIKFRDPVVSVATNGHFLRTIRHDYSSKLGQDVIIPRTAIELITAKPEEHVQISLGDDKIRFKWDDGRILTSRLINEKYPDYESVFPKLKNMKTAKINREELLRAVNDLKPFANQTTEQIRFDIKQKSLKLSTFDPERDTGSEIDLDIKSTLNGESFAIGLNAQYLASVLKTITGKTVEFKFDKPISATIWQSSDKGVRTLLMPIRLAENILTINKVRCSMTFKDWFNTFIDEKELNREHVFKIKHEGTLHLMEFENLVDSILALPAEYQKKIKDKIVKIDFINGDVLHYLKYVAEGLVKYKTSEV